MLQIQKKKAWICTKNASPGWVEVLREGRKGVARDFYIKGDFNVELGLMCTDENNEEELTELKSPLFQENCLVWDHERI